MAESFPGEARQRWYARWRKPRPAGAVLRDLGYGFVALTLALIALPYILVVLYIFVDPPYSALTLRETIAGHRVSQTWRTIDRISPQLIAQVIVSEDGRYCDHRGVDWTALREAVTDEEGKPRGASTITMQTAKNLFLWNRPAFIRKAFELPLALFMDLVLGKRRVAELYFNVAQWGPGIFGAEEAARYHFQTTAADLTAQEAAQLAASLPAPTRRNAGNPGNATASLARRLKRRLQRDADAAACLLPSR